MPPYLDTQVPNPYPDPKAYCQQHKVYLNAEGIECPVCTRAERDRYRAALVQLWTNSDLTPHQSDIVRDALGL